MENKGDRRRLLGVIIGIAVLVALGPLAFWLGGNLVGFLFIGVWIAVVAVVALRGDRSGVVEVASGSADVHRILVVAHAGADGEALAKALSEREADDEIHIVVPALTTRANRFSGEVDDAIKEAQAGVERLVNRTNARGRTVDGAVGDADPRMAVEDALRVFAADEVLVVPPPDEELEFFRVSGPKETFQGVPLPVTVVHG
jgi:hypothetical protein